MKAFTSSGFSASISARPHDTASSPRSRLPVKSSSFVLGTPISRRVLCVPAQEQQSSQSLSMQLRWTNPTNAQPEIGNLLQAYVLVIESFPELARPCKALNVCCLRRYVVCSPFNKFTPPPRPGMMPRPVSGKPMLALCDTVLMSAAIASSAPPPSAAPS